MSKITDADGVTLITGEEDPEDIPLEYIASPLMFEEPNDDKEMAAGEVDKEWQEYEGPQGGEGWENTVTGERRYQEEKPDDESSIDFGETVRSWLDQNSDVAQTETARYISEHTESIRDESVELPEPTEISRPRQIAEFYEAALTLTHGGAFESIDGIYVEDITEKGYDMNARYDFEENTIIFPEEMPDWDWKIVMEDEGHTVDGTPEGLFLHELAHSLHANSFDSEAEIAQHAEDTIAENPDFFEPIVGEEEENPRSTEISTYAGVDFKEFVAEMFVGLVRGNSYDDDLMRAYEELGGPDEWREWRDTF